MKATIIREHANRYDFLGKDGYLQKARETQRKDLEEELKTLQAKIAAAECVPQEEGIMANA